MFWACTENRWYFVNFSVYQQLGSITLYDVRRYIGCLFWGGVAIPSYIYSLHLFFIHIFFRSVIRQCWVAIRDKTNRQMWEKKIGSTSPKNNEIKIYTILIQTIWLGQSNQWIMGFNSCVNALRSSCHWERPTIVIRRSPLDTVSPHNLFTKR